VKFLLIAVSALAGSLISSILVYSVSLEWQLPIWLVALFRRSLKAVLVFEHHWSMLMAVSDVLQEHH